MLYFWYQKHADMMRPVRVMARTAKQFLDPIAELPGGDWVRPMAATLEMVGRSKFRHRRPSYRIKPITMGNREVPVFEEAALTTPFGTLLHFRKDSDAPQPKVLVVAPLSGHFATLLRGTVQTLLAEHDVYLTDWHNARYIPPSAGRFGFDDYTEHLIQFLEHMGPNSHIVAVCQPCVQALVATAVMSEAGNPATPASMTLMAGPVDTRVNPTEVNRLAQSNSIAWFEENLISTVPCGVKGAGRRVYPGFLQTSAFVMMNRERHQKAHFDLFFHLAKGEKAEADVIKKFYDEYFAVLDLTAEFYLETVQKVFQDAQLAQGTLTYRGKRVDPKAIRRTALLTVEGERDDICAPGQTVAAHDLCSNLKPYMKRHHLQAGVGHYGVFSGKKWETQVYPNVRNLMLSTM